MGKYRNLGVGLGRDFRNDLNANFEDIDTDIKQQNQRVDDLITGVEQPSEVVDARGGMPVLRDRLDATDAQLAQNTNAFSFREKGVVFAHRGFRVLAPENTIPAWELAGEYGFFGIETDIRMTSDGELFCYHNDELADYTNGSGTVGSSTSDYLRSLVMTDGGNIENYPNTKLATFEEFIKVASKHNMWILPELNDTSAGVITKTKELIDKYGYWNRTVFASASRNILQSIRAFNKNVPLWYVTFRPVTDEDIEFCKTISPSLMGIGVNGGFLEDGFIEKAHSSGVMVAAYTVNDYGDYLKLSEQGVDCFCSDQIIGGGVK